MSKRHVASSMRVRGLLLSYAAASETYTACVQHSGYYVIYANKEMNNKPHLTSWHAWLGFGALIGWIALALVGLLGLHPELAAVLHPPRPFVLCL